MPSLFYLAFRLGREIRFPLHNLYKINKLIKVSNVRRYCKECYKENGTQFAELMDRK